MTPNVRGRAFMVGDICADLVLHVPGETGNAYQQPEPEVYGGGTVANTAAALARLDMETHFVGVAGDDVFGRRVAGELERDGIDISHLAYSDRWPTMLVIALIDSTGQRTVFGWPRRNQAFADLHEAQVAGIGVQADDWVHTSGVCLVQEQGRAATYAALDLAARQAARSSFDLNLRLGLEGRYLPAAYIDAVWHAIQRADFVLGSVDEELFHLIPDEPDPGRATAQLADRGQCVAVMREGRRGAHISEYGAHSFTIPPFDVPVLDTLGAGDAFNAGFIHAGLSGRALSEQARWGHAVAGLQIGGAGARSAPTRQAVMRFLAAKAPDLLA